MNRLAFRVRRLRARRRAGWADDAMGALGWLLIGAGLALGIGVLVTALVYPDAFR